MDKKRALLCAIVTAIVIFIISGIAMCGVYGILLLMEKLYDVGGCILVLIVPLLLAAVIVAIKAYRYFRKEYIE